MATVALPTDIQNDVERRVDKQITEARLRRGDNRFFAAAKNSNPVTPECALAIAIQFHAMTRMFMFSTISGLGVMARTFSHQKMTDRQLLGVFQTAYHVIGDDLCNIDPEFDSVAPRGPAGIHYLWWYESILGPIAAHVDEARQETISVIPPAVQQLLDNMDRLATHPFGAAVQLRVVETIAQDVAVAFRRMLANMTVDGQSIFPAADDLAWVDSHIRAETSHARKVSDHEVGMAGIVMTELEAEEFVQLTGEYAVNWSRSIEGYVNYLDVPE